MLGDPGGRGVQVGVDQGGLVLPGVGDLPGQTLVQHAAEGVGVGPPVQAPALELLGGRVVKGPHELPGGGDPGVRGGPLGQAEVRQIHAVGGHRLRPGGDQDVARLDVAVDQALGMSRV